MGTAMAWVCHIHLCKDGVGVQSFKDVSAIGKRVEDLIPGELRCKPETAVDIPLEITTALP